MIGCWFIIIASTGCLFLRFSEVSLLGRGLPSSRKVCCQASRQNQCEFIVIFPLPSWRSLSSVWPCCSWGLQTINCSTFLPRTDGKCRIFQKRHAQDAAQGCHWVFLLRFYGINRWFFSNFPCIRIEIPTLQCSRTLKLQKCPSHRRGIARNKRDTWRIWLANRQRDTSIALPYGPMHTHCWGK